MDNLVASYRNRAEVAEAREAGARERADGLRRERDALTEQADEDARARNELLHKVQELRTKLRESQANVTRLRREAQTQSTTGAGFDWDQVTAVFLDPETQLRWEIELAWALHVSPAEKDQYRIPAYLVGPKFTESLDRLQGVGRGKVLAVIVDVLTDRAKDAAGRRMHRLRSSSAGNSPIRKRDDGALAFRVALQRGTPAARQLHYWQLPSGQIELAQVGVHDDGLV
jgi:hypothetical protein